MLPPPPRSTLFPYTTLFRSNYFRGTSAHSTVVVDGASQALPSGPFGWQTRPSGQLRAWKSTETSDYVDARSEEHTSELQSHVNLVCRLLLEKKKKKTRITTT